MNYPKLSNSAHRDCRSVKKRATEPLDRSVFQPSPYFIHTVQLFPLAGKQWLEREVDVQHYLHFLQLSNAAMATPQRHGSLAGFTPDQRQISTQKCKPDRLQTRPAPDLTMPRRPDICSMAQREGPAKWRAAAPSPPGSLQLRTIKPGSPQP